jgi:hypothetical protein
MGVPEPLASTVATRALVALGQDLVPYRRRSRELERAAAAAGEPGAPPTEEDTKPRLRLNDASEARSRTVKRA